jgi:hypothetical protein
MTSMCIKQGDKVLEFHSHFSSPSLSTKEASVSLSFSFTVHFLEFQLLLTKKLKTQFLNNNNKNKTLTP